MTRKERITTQWRTMSWFNPFSSGPTMLANKIDMVIEIIILMLLMRRNDSVSQRRLTEELVEHVFGSYIMQKREGVQSLDMISMKR